MNTRQTSIDCYNEIRANGLLSKKRLEVYKAILKTAPCTSGEAFSIMTTKENQISQSRARFTELRELGVIRNVIEWDLTDRLPISFKNKNKTKKQRINDAINSFRELYKNKDNSKNEDWKIVADLIKII